MKKETKKLSTVSLQKLLSHSWPGNVRELENTLEYAMAMSTQDMITDDLIFQGENKRTEKGKLKPLKEARNEFEKEYIQNLLLLAGGNVSKSARLAQKHRSDIYDLLKKHQMKPADFKKTK